MQTNLRDSEETLWRFAFDYRDTDTKQSQFDIVRVSEFLKNQDYLYF